MRDLSLHLLDLTMNSIKANATLIQILIYEKLDNDTLIITLKDNGDGMDNEMLSKVRDPFFTTRTTRKVGFGIPLYLATIERCDGSLEITSNIGSGTELSARLQLNHIDRPPFGNIHETLLTLIKLEPTIDFVYDHIVENESYHFDTREIKTIIKDIPINHIDIMQWIKNELQEGDIPFTSY